MKKNLAVFAVALFCSTLAFADEPKNSAAFRNRGYERFVACNVDGAIADFTSAINLDRGDAAAYLWRAGARLAKGDADGAIADATVMTGVRGFRASAYFLRGTARFDKGDMKEAIEDFQKAMELDTSAVPPNLYGSHLIALAKGDTDGALSGFGKLIETMPKHSLAYYWRGRTFLIKGETEKAVADFNTAIKLQPEVKCSVQPWLDKAEAQLKKP